MRKYYDVDDVGLSTELEGSTHWAHHDLLKAGITVDVWVKPSGAPILEFSDGTFVSFGLHEIIAEALWCLEVGED